MQDTQFASNEFTLPNNQASESLITLYHSPTKDLAGPSHAARLRFGDAAAIAPARPWRRSRRPPSSTRKTAG